MQLLKKFNNLIKKLTPNTNITKEYVIASKPKKLKPKSITVERDQKGNKKNFNFNQNMITHEERTPSGRRCVDVGDVVADLFRGDTIGHVYAKTTICLNDLGIETTEKQLRERYKGKKEGVQRMCLSNLLRGALNDPANKNKKLPRFRTI